MAMLMGISLMVYNLCELKLREALQQNNQFFEDPSLAQSDNPTIRRIFQTFEGIQVNYATWGGKIIRETVLNKKPWHGQVLGLMGGEYKRRYEDGRDDLTDLITSQLKKLDRSPTDNNKGSIDPE